MPAALLLGVLWGLVGCRGVDRIEDGPVPGTDAPPPVAFTDVTAQAGLGDFVHENGATGNRWFPEAMGSGGSFVDLDGDAWPDIALAGGGRWPGEGEPVQAVRLYRNNRDGSFTEVTEAMGVGHLFGYSYGVLGADYDNDGDEDLFVTQVREDLLLRNDGGTFTEVARQAGVDGGPQWSTSAIFFDADRDGWLDLYVGRYVKWSMETDIPCELRGGIRSYCTPQLYEGLPSRFYRNNGDGTFTDRTEEAGFLPAPGKTLGVAHTDVDRDGWPDLMVANDTQRNLLYVNQGDGTFAERGAVSGMAYDENGIARAGMGIDVGIVDTTGGVTLFVGNFSKEAIAVYQYIGNGLFVDRAGPSKIGRPSLLTLTFGLFLFDVDLDGDLDLFAANGHVQPEIEQTQQGITYREPPHLFVNDGEGVFADAVPALGKPLNQPLLARGAAYADYDRDGDLDVLLTENAGPAHLWRNDLRSKERPEGGPGYLRVVLEGTRGNRDALGARVTAVAGSRRMVQWVRTGSSFMSQMDRAVVFGLGAIPKVDSLIVTWPGGDEEVLRDVTANQEIVIVEGSAPVAARADGRSHGE